MDDKPKQKKQKKKNKSLRWAVTVTIVTFVLAFLMNFVSESVIVNASMALALVVLLVIILIGIVFDIIGIAVTAASETPFHSMAAAKVAGATHALLLIKSSERVSNVCNDVIGDVAGILSGGTAAVIAAKLVQTTKGLDSFWIGLCITALVAALTVGGKGAGKAFAVAKSSDIVFFVGKLFYFFDFRKGKKKKKVKD